MITHPSRIVSLAAEATETLYLLNQQDRIVGISGFTARPPQARRDKPRISGSAHTRLERILALQPDLVLGLSVPHAELLGSLAQRGVGVHLFNHNSIAGILQMIRMLGGMIGCETQAADLASRLEWRLEALRVATAHHELRPRVYFEEWDEPQTTGAGWVSELIAIAGGEDCFTEIAGSPHARDRILPDSYEVVRRAPDIIVGSWCGRKFRPQRVAERQGWCDVPAVAENELHEIKSSIILAPGPAALTEGLAALHGILQKWRDRVSTAMPAQASAH